MNRQIGRLGLGVLAAYLVLFAQLNWLHVFNAQTYREHPALVLNMNETMCPAIMSQAIGYLHLSVV